MAGNISEMFCGAADGGRLGIYNSDSGLGAAVTTDVPLNVTPGAGQSAQAPATWATAAADVRGKLFVENDVCTFVPKGSVLGIGEIKAPLKASPSASPSTMKK
ncbi:MAG: hypothetical protein IAE63_10100 [Alphaproteobacteria bacterium]|nr:hypothetical protein [Alphaproteobacteria bacterium]